MKPKHLNVREHLKHAAIIEEGLQKFGYCPAIEQELKMFFFINRALLRKAEELKLKNRKDLPL
jgi:hypothetical protein